MQVFTHSFEGLELHIERRSQGCNGSPVIPGHSAEPTQELKGADVEQRRRKEDRAAVDRLHVPPMLNLASVHPEHITWRQRVAGEVNVMYCVTRTHLDEEFEGQPLRIRELLQPTTLTQAGKVGHFRLGDQSRWGVEGDIANR